MLKESDMPQLPVYYCRRTATAPASLAPDDAAWHNAETITLVQATSGEPPRQATRCKLAWDDETLYVGFWCDDKSVYSSMTEDGQALYDEEVVEVFIDDDCDERSYAEIEVNPHNAVLQLYILKRGEVWKQLWDWRATRMRTHVAVNGDPSDPNSADRGWSAFLAIPLEDFCTAPNLPPAVGDRWRINLYRIDRHADGDEYSAWSPPGRDAFHTPKRFGWLEFGA